MAFGFAGVWLNQLPSTSLLRQVCQLIPHYWANVAFQDLFVRGQGLAEITPSLLAVLGFTSIQPLQTLRLRSVDRADEKVAAGEAPVAIVIPAHFSARIDANQPARVRLIKDPTRQAEAQALAGILTEVLTELRVRAEIEYGIRAVNAKTGALEGADSAAARAAQAQTIGAIWTAVQEIRRNPAIAVQREDLVGQERVITPQRRCLCLHHAGICHAVCFFPPRDDGGVDLE